MILAAMEVQWSWQADGGLRLLLDGVNVLAGPLGVLLYLVIAPWYRFVPASWRSPFLVITSLFTALLTLGPAYVATLIGMVLFSLAVVRFCGPRGHTLLGGLALIAVHLAWGMFPQPAWLPQVKEPLYFYLHWAGIAYLMLRSYHVMMDVARRRLPLPPVMDYLAYLLFAPTLRMGPFMRYQAFAGPLHGDPRQECRLGIAAGRILTGLIRLAATSWLVNEFPASKLYHPSPDMGLAQIMLHVYAVILALYFWISAYTDLAVAVGRVMGFVVPDNFNYPWRATSIDEFWRRWHIPIYEWLKDYVFMPLARRRWHYFASFTATFLVCGFWHGTYLTYLFWGLSQGVGMGTRRWWSHLWRRQAERRTGLYMALKRGQLVASPLNTAFCWLLTFNYQAVTISLGLDGANRCRHLLRHVWTLF